mmetsp:Transcript_5256/g.15286  ORF Transcript_5256/g.15286 Transcript_5256/m.15286 type:complete len:262 (-) Transcript_5256:511-1296(-)
MRSQICGNSRCDDVVGSSDKNTHAAEHEKKDGGVQVRRFRDLGKDCQKDNQHSHENSNNERTATSKNVGNISNNDTSGHHTNRVKGGDKIGGDRVKVSSQEIWEPEKQTVVGKLEETKGKGVVGNHRNAERIVERNSLRTSILFNGFSLLGHFLFLGLVLRLTNLDFGGDDSHVVGVSNKLDGDEGEENVGHGRDEKCPDVGTSGPENPSGDKTSRNITHVLMASPETENHTTLFDGLGIAEPVSHDSSSDRSPSSLEESE